MKDKTKIYEQDIIANMFSVAIIEKVNSEIVSFERSGNASRNIIGC